MKKVFWTIVLCFLATSFQAEAKTDPRHAISKTSRKTACFPLSTVLAIGIDKTIEMLHVGLYAKDKKNSPVSVSVMFKKDTNGEMSACVIFVDVPIVEVDISGRLIV